MIEAEAQKTYEALLHIVRETRGLGWVADQAEQLVSFGHLEERQISTVSRRPDEAAPASFSGTRGWTQRRSSRTAAYTESIQFTGREKLLILLDAVSSATVGAAAIEQEVAALASEGFPVELTHNSEPTAELSFLDDGSERESVSTAAGRSAAVEPLKKLQGLIDELRAAADAT